MLYQDTRTKVVYNVFLKQNSKKGNGNPYLVYTMYFERVKLQKLLKSK